MEWLIDISTTIGIFAAALMILVFVHELGHFLAAKAFGMRVERFSIGFPPRIWGFQKGETDYCIGATPLGGYVKITGMIDESMDTDHLDEEPKPWEYRSKPVWQRIVVITAGVIFNMVLAVFIFAGMGLTYGESKVPLESVEGIYVAEGSVAEDAGFKTNDRIEAVNGQEVPYFEDLFSPSKITGSSLTYTINRSGQQETVNVPGNLLDRVNREGFIELSHAMPAQIGQVIDGTPADEAGFEDGDEITAANGEPISYWLELVEKIQEADGALQLTINRDGSTEEISVTPNESKQIGIAPPAAEEVFEIDRIQYGLAGSLGLGIQKTNETLTGIIQGFQQMFSGSISVKENLGGPVAIANVTKQATDVGGMAGFWNITAFLSITLAIMNILPIPVLDGGHLVFLIYEGITRREPSAKVRMALQQIGFILIIALFIYVTFNDIVRQFGG